MSLRVVGGRGIGTLGAVALGLASFAQSARTQVVPDFAEEWRWSDFGTAVGVPQGRVLSMAEDGEHVWLHTADRVAYFDGFVWEPVPALDSVGPIRHLHAVPGSPVAVAASGGLFVGGRTGFRSVRIPGLEPEAEVARVAWADSATLYFMTVHLDDRENPRSLFTWRSGLVAPVEAPGPLRGSDPALWGTNGGGAYAVTASAIHRAIPPAGWETVAEDTAGRSTAVLYVSANAAGEGLAHWSPGAREAITWTPAGILDRDAGEGDHVVRSSTVTPEGLRLAVFDNGVMRVGGPEGWTLAPIPPSRSLGMTAVFATRSGDIWLSSFQGLHLFRAPESRWTRIHPSDLPGGDRINDFFVDSETGEVWLATGAGVVRYRNGEATPFFELGGRALRATTTVARDSTGAVWFGSGSAFHGAYRIHPDGSWTALGTEGELGPVHRIRTDSRGRVYLMVLGPAAGGVYRANGPGGLERLQDPEGVLASAVYTMAEGPDGALWFGGGGGVARLADGTWTSWPSSGWATPGPRVWDMALSPEGEVWLTLGRDVESVISRLDPETGRLLPQDSDDGLAARGAWSVRFDDEGALWAGTASGLSRFKDGNWTQIDSRQGLGAALVWPIRFTPTEILAGTANGLMVLKRDGPFSAPPPKVLVEADRGAAGSVRWQWTVAGFRGEPRSGDAETRHAIDDGGWSRWSRQRSLDTMLSPGRHTLRLQAKGAFGQLSQVESDEIRVLPPLLLRPVIWAPGVLLAGGLLFFGVQARRQRRERDAAVRASEGRLRALLELAPEGILIYDGHSHELVEANEQVQRLLGLDSAELLGQTPASLSPTAQPSGLVSVEGMAGLLARALETDEVVEVEWSFRGSGGASVPTLLRLSRLPEPEAHLVRLSLVDLTERKRAEELRRSLEVQLVQAQKLEAVGQLTGGLAHDFNNLLTVIRGNLEFLRSSPSTPEAARWADQAMGAAERGTELVKRLLAFSERQPLAPARLVLGDALTELLPLVERSLGSAVRTSLQVADAADAVMVDRSQLESAVMNLVVNARDAMPDGGTLRISTERVRIDGATAEFAEVEPGDYVRLTLADNGVGMAPELLQHVFEPFFTTKEVGRGSGLGLSMVYGFARQSGGFARITSEPGRGTQVHMHLPLLKREQAEPGKRDGAPGRGRAFSTSGLRVLVVEDDPALRTLLESLLLQFGHRVAAAGNAKEAEALVNRGFRPDVLVADVILPGARNGPALARDLAGMLPGLAVAFISGYQREHLPMDLDPEAPFLPKPFDGAQLEELIRQAAAERAQGD